jgi:hypothetical protein
MFSRPCLNPPAWGTTTARAGRRSQLTAKDKKGRQDRMSVSFEMKSFRRVFWVEKTTAECKPVFVGTEPRTPLVRCRPVLVRSAAVVSNSVAAEFLLALLLANWAFWHLPREAAVERQRLENGSRGRTCSASVENTGLGGAVTIPGTINALPATRIGDFAFAGSDSVTLSTRSAPELREPHAPQVHSRWHPSWPFLASNAQTTARTNSRQSRRQYSPRKIAWVEGKERSLFWKRSDATDTSRRR